MNALPLGAQPHQDRQSKWPWRPMIFACVCAVCFVAIFIVPNYVKCHCGGPLTACKSNCKNIATALEMYATDNQGCYPDELEKLIPGNYLQRIPTCPSAGYDGYSSSYTVEHKPERYRFYCRGDFHQKSYAGFSGNSRNYPQYHSEIGLLDHP